MEGKYVKLKDIPDAKLNSNGYYEKLPKFFIDLRCPSHPLVKIEGKVKFSHVDGFPLGDFHLPIDDDTVVMLLN